MEPPELVPEVEGALRAERRFVLALGGFGLEIPGAVLVTHEKIPSPRFNYVEVRGVAPDRQTAFFERALDHYFQRALRPTFRVPLPVPEFLDAGLRRFAFRPAAEPRELWLDDPAAPAPDPGDAAVEVSDAAEVDRVAAFWTEEAERPELRTGLDLALHHPPPGEALVPVLARVDGAPVAAALLYRAGRAAGIHLVTTRPDARGRGAASALLAYARRRAPFPTGVRYSILTEGARAAPRLERLGFARAQGFAQYELPRDAELALPPPGPPGPPRWRPPR